MNTVWTTYRRRDDTPAANVYHFVTGAHKVYRIQDGQRPTIDISNPFKVAVSHLNILSKPAVIPQRTIWNHREAHIFWQLSKTAYDTPEDWFAEVGRTGEAVMWLPSNDIVDWWVKRKMKPWVFIVHAIKDGAYAGKERGQIVAVVEPEWVYYPVDDQTNMDIAESVAKFGQIHASGRIRLVDVALLDPNNKRIFIPFSHPK